MDLQLLVGDGGIIGAIGVIITAIFTVLGYVSKKTITSTDDKDEKAVTKKEHKFGSFLSRHRRKLLVVCVICVIFTAVNIFVNSMNLFPELPVKYSYAVKDDKTLCITGLPDDSVTNLEIPEKILGKTVTEIGDRAFADCTSITSVTIPASVKLIGSNAFLNCTSLTHINVAADNENYSSAEGILFNKTKTNLVYYPDGKNIGEVVKSGTCGDTLTWDLYESGVLIISGFGNMMNFEDISTNPWHDNCSDITSVIFNGSVTSIGARAFQDCSNLTSIVMPDSIAKIEHAAFEYCSSLTSITIPDLVTEIKAATFFSCSSLTDVTLPDSITSIEGTAFYYCSSLSNIVIPKSVVGIGSLAFQGCRNLKSITIPDSVIDIGESAFRFCNNLTDIKLPNSITYIKQLTFADCGSLKSISIPDSVTEIGYDAFARCTNLVDIKMPKSASTFEKGIFFKCTSLNSIVIPDGVSSIEVSTFLWCINLTSVTIPKSVTNIVEYAFGYCTNLTDVYYEGSEEDWKKIKIGKINDCFTNATIHYNSQQTAE